MNSALKESLRIIDKNCKDCKVAKLIQNEHGYQSKLEYCSKSCVHGKKINALQKEINFGYEAIKGFECTEENYLFLQSRGMMDKDICVKFGISKDTLIRRKRFWGFDRMKPEKKLTDRTVEEFLELKKDHLNDDEIAKRWNVGKSTLSRWKKKNNLQGFLFLEKRTKQEYLDLKLQGKTDVEIARLWRTWKGGLQKWKQAHNIRGGLRR
ncbi:zinc-finger domain-containing protein [Cytobacillus pseudoceanisediminis]|uniref:Zinc-finger domain-containing protein n=1 Tax=Cytobacillus pseudoceanisediminis TaxID=3051614 RepID=A0ABZ2ZGC9_9BACI